MGGIGNEYPRWFSGLLARLFRFSSQLKLRFLSSLPHPGTHWNKALFLPDTGGGSFFKKQQNGDVSLLPSSAEINIVWSYTSIPLYVFMEP
jgi:hypothetical protein